MRRRSIIATARAGILLALVAATLAGCGASRSSYVHPNVDFGFMQRAGVLPFRNLSGDPLAGQRLQSIFLMEILEADVLDIVDPGETLAAMRKAGVLPNAAPTPEQAVALGEALGVDALFFGIIEEYGENPGDRSRGPEITATFGLIETQTGVVVWRAQTHATGGSVWRRILGNSPADIFHVSQRVVRDALGTLI